MNFILLSPQRKIYEGEVDSVTVPGMQGSFTVWENHAALISTLKEGVLVLRQGGKEVQQFHVDGGFVEVRDNKVSVCVERLVEGA